MKKIAIAERPDWKQTAERLGFMFHTIDGEPYWDESAYYQFSLKQIEDDLEDPTQALHELCMDLVAKVVESEELLERLSIPAAYHDLVRTSWLEGHPHLYGRMDFSYDGNGPAKLLELNYDTPTSLYEAAAFQWGWLEQGIERGMLPAGVDQFNSIDTRLHEAFAALNIQRPFYFASIKGSVEDKATTDYLRLIADKVGIESRHIDLEDIGLLDGRFVDLQDRWIPHLFKLHAWEFIFHEPFGAAIAQCDTQFIEPAWKAFCRTRAFCRCCGRRTKATRTCWKATWTPTRAQRCRRAGCASRISPARARTSSCARRMTSCTWSTVPTTTRPTSCSNWRRCRSSATARRWWVHG